MERCQCVSPITLRLMTWLWRGKYCIGERRKDQRDESTLWLFSINIPVYLQRLDGWCKQSKPQLKFLWGRKSTFSMTTYLREKNLTSSPVALDSFEGFGGVTNQGRFIELMCCLTSPAVLLLKSCTLTYRYILHRRERKWLVSRLYSRDHDGEMNKTNLPSIITDTDSRISLSCLDYKLRNYCSGIVSSSLLFVEGEKRGRRVVK